MPVIFYVSYVAMWILLLIPGFLVLLIYRHFGLMAMGSVEGVQRDGLSVGERAPAISGITVQGEVINWTPQPTRRYFLAFVSPNCSPCARVLPFINQLAITSSDLKVLLLASSKDNLHQLVEKYHPSSSILCLADLGKGTMEQYRVRVTPFAFLIGEDGRVLAKGLCDSKTRLQEMLAVGGRASRLDIPPQILQIDV